MRLEGFTDVSALLQCGVYALVFHGEVVYVGKSKRLYARIYSHRNLAGRDKVSWAPIKGYQFDEVHIFPCRPDRLDALEREMIARYRPRHNRLLKPPAGPGPLRLILDGREVLIPLKPAPAPPQRSLRRA